jgi:hypothetical protein
MPHDGRMERTAGVALRWTRAGLLSAVAMVSGVVAHESANGILPGPVALAVLFVVCTALAATQLGRPASTLRVVVLVMAGQTFVHGTLTALSGHRGDPPLKRVAAAPSFTPAVGLPTGPGRRGSYFQLAYAQQHPGSGHVALTIPAPVQHLMADMTGAHATMALAHLAAAAVVGLWLAVGERALWAIVALVADSTRFVVSATAASYASALGVADAMAAAIASLGLCRPDLHVERLPRRSLVLERVVVRRGPPSLLPA